MITRCDLSAAILFKLVDSYLIAFKFTQWRSINTKELGAIHCCPRACLLNRPPVPAMDLKSNRSGLWRHMLETCRRLRRLCRKHSNNVARHDKTPVSHYVCRATKIFCRATWFSCRVGVTLCCDFYTLHALSVCLLLQCCDIWHNFWCRPVYYKTLIYETTWSILFWNHANDVTSYAKLCLKYDDILHQFWVLSWMNLNEYKGWYVQVVILL